MATSPPAPPPPPSKPLAAQHLEQAREDYAAYQVLKTDGQYLGWAVTILFYAVMHLVEACLIEYHGGRGEASHPKRENAVYAHLRPIYNEYHHLHTRSTWARYHPDKPKPTLAGLQRYETEWLTPIVDHLAQRGIRLTL